MKKFQFRLDGLLRVRKVEEQRAESAFLAKKSEFDRAEQERASLQLSRREHLDALAGLGEGELPMHKIIAHRRMLNGLATKVGMVEEQMRQLSRELVPLQTALQQAVRNRKAVDRLRERRYEEYLVESRREESAWLDEVGRSRHALAGEESPA